MAYSLKRFSGYAQNYRYIKRPFCLIGELIRETDTDYCIRLFCPQQLNWGRGWTIPTRFYSFGKDHQVRIYLSNQQSLELVLMETPVENGIIWTSMADVDSTCPICFDNNITVGTGCGHGFCDKCFLSLSTNVCPICRDQVTQFDSIAPRCEKCYHFHGLISSHKC
jgi:hypothetical protein